MKRASRALLFLSIFGILFAEFLHAFSFHYDERIKSFYQLKKGTADVVFLGCSHTYRNIDPSVLWEKYGYTGYDLGSPAQWTSLSYYQMKEAIKAQHPKVIVYEAYKCYHQKEYPEEAVTVKAVSGIRDLQNKWQAITANVEDPDQRIYYFLEFPWFHSRYEELKAADFAPAKKEELSDCYLGYDPYFASVPTDMDGAAEVTEVKPLSDKTLYYLDEMRRLAAENDCEFMLLLTPYKLDFSKKQPYYNALEQYARENNVPFFNMDYMFDEIGLDEETDIGRSRHLSLSGAYKVTEYLADYMHEHYDLTDHRGQKGYERWEENAALLGEYRSGTKVTEEKTEDEAAE
ncbi:MAG: hypothetical protein K6E75_08190 [Lachnospiraceae bacterium]|nr:hypothetical protein [Lachnospiraceae bacterium]